MSLLKLWNSIRSVATGSAATGETADIEAGKPKVADKTVDQAVAGRVPAAARPDPATAAAVKVPAAKPVKSGLLSGVLRSCPHAGLTKQFKGLSVNTVLEVGVGDGTRAIAILQSLLKANPDAKIHYIAVDQFEMNGGIELRAFHKQLRGISSLVNLLPMPTRAGLDRVARTYGQVDLLIWNDPEVNVLSAPLDRICKASGSVFLQTDGKWSKMSTAANATKAA
ncbi:hypothetical protein [Stieleria varia]|uniref:Uncharacterized protein n=1 Tax=Stieleria varia TaxID=2528005 RepID=A0A5C6AY42_9BACT|nr:hypothetical protein [Stieleria varia]TWU04548.1 hypothetical protein Pla52n_25900 [Stieleria varia]